MLRLYVWRGTTRNFGDELNHLLWPRLLPGLFDPRLVGERLLDPGAVADTGSDDAGSDNAGSDDVGSDDVGSDDAGSGDAGSGDAGSGDAGSALFLGIGSVLDARHPPKQRKIVAGAGFGGYQRPASLDGSWEIYWVRGPRTARQLGLPAAFGLGDPASLLPLAHPVARQDTGAIGFMPHFESLALGAWPEAAAAAGLTLIDPRGAPQAIISQIAGCRALLSEALHGVIVADALRVPWVALTPVAPIHRAKWLDWADSLDLTIRFHTLPPTSLGEYIETTFTAHRRIMRVGLLRAAALANRIGRQSACLARAAASLRQAAAAPPQLSDWRALARAQDRMLNRLHTLRAGHAAAGEALASWR